MIRHLYRFTIKDLPQGLDPSNFLPNIEGERDIFYETFHQVFQDEFLGAGKKASDAFGLSVSFDLDDPQLGTAISTFTWKFADEINKTTISNLRKELKAGLEEGETIEDLRRRVQSVFDGTVRGTAPRARLIARTETTGLVNKARFHAYDRSGEVESLIWLTAGDERVRPTHVAANGQMRKIGELFDVGGSKLRFPGDKAHGAHVKEVANCRCTILPTLTDLEIPEFEEPDPDAFPFAVEDMKHRADISLGGMHTKYVFEDPNGDLWLYKPVHEEFRAYADVAASKIAKEVGIPTPDIYALEFRHPAVGPKSFGSIQKMYDNVLAPISTSLPPDDVGYAAIQREHIFDWLIGNHDSHGENLLFLKDGSVVGIDKGQAWKFYLRDSLDTSYNPNPLPSYYNSAFFENYAKGGYVDLLPFDDDRIQGLLKRIDDLDEDRYVEIVTPYLDAHPYLGGDRGKFEAELLRRKREIRKDIESFYAGIEERRNAALGIFEPSAAPAAFEELVPQVIDDAFMGSVEEAGWLGRHVFFGGDTWEDMKVRIYRVGDRTVIEGKIRQEVADKLRPSIEKDAVKAAGLNLGSASATTPSADPYWGDVLTVIKSVKHHLMDPNHDGIVPDKTVKLWKDLNDKLKAQYTLSAAGSEQERMILQYLDMLKTIGGSPGWPGVGQNDPQWDLAALAGQFSPYAPKVPVTTPSAAAGGSKFSLQKGTLDQDYARKIANGKIEPIQGTQIMPRLASDDGLTARAELEPGIKFEWVFGGDGTVLSRQNRVRVYVDGTDAGLVRNALEHLDDMGLETKFATLDDMEYLYLMKNAWASDLWKDSFIRDNILQNVPKLKTSREKADYLKGQFEAALGKSPDEFKDYSFLPHYEKHWNPVTKQMEEGVYGMPRWFRFDIDREGDWFKKHRLIHQNMGRDSLEDLIDAILEDNGAFIPNEDKMRVGIPVRMGTGMSPEDDMRRGGATHFFTRIRTIDNAWQRPEVHTSKGYYADFVFKADMLAEVNQISYPRDLYGDMGVQYRVKQLIDWRARDEDTWHKYAGNNNNESLVRGEFQMLSYLEHVIAKSDAQRQRILDVFKKHNVTEINGVPIEDVVVVAGFKKGPS